MFEETTKDEGKKTKIEIRTKVPMSPEKARKFANWQSMGQLKKLTNCKITSLMVESEKHFFQGIEFRDTLTDEILRLYSPLGLYGVFRAQMIMRKGFSKAVKLEIGENEMEEYIKDHNIKPVNPHDPPTQNTTTPTQPTSPQNPHTLTTQIPTKPPQSPLPTKNIYPIPRRPVVETYD